MKKNLILLLSLLLILSLSLMLTGCSTGEAGLQPEDGAGTDPEDISDVPQTVTEIVNIACLNGPTGMGAVRLMEMPEKYNVEIYQSPTDAVPKLISGEIDAACLPSNMAAVLYNKTGGEVWEICPMVKGVLYVVGNGTGDITSIEDLKGKTIVSSGQGGTPEYALTKILNGAGLEPGKDVQLKWLASHADVNAELLNNEGTVAMMPEPFVSAALSKAPEKVNVIFDMNEEWLKATGQDFPMGVLVARKDFIESRKGDLEVLLKDLQSSVSEVNTASEEICRAVVDAGFLGDAEVAEKAIPNCGLELSLGEDGVMMMKAFNEIMFSLNPEAVGGKLPEDDFYYKGE